MIRAVLFDMDGVLIDAADWHYQALNDALELFGMQIGRQEHLSTFDGLPTAKKLTMLSEKRNLPVGLHPLLNKLKQKRTLAITAQTCRPTFNHQYALSRLKHDGYKIAVCSNSVKNTIEAMMQAADLSKYLDFCLSNEDVTRPKPDPEIYQMAMERLELRPEETLILEDNDHGIKAARSSGAHVMEIGSVHDVTYDNISRRIEQVNVGQ